MDLTTHYMGLQLKNPLVASASPLSADLGNLRQLEDSGAAAIVLPSIFEEQIEADMLRETLTAVGRESSPAARGHLPEASQREPQQYLDLIRRAVEAVDIPIIGSLNGTTEEGWINYAKMNRRGWRNQPRTKCILHSNRHFFDRSRRRAALSRDIAGGPQGG